MACSRTMARSIRAFWLGVSLRTAIGSTCCFFAPRWGNPAAGAERDVAATKAKARLTAVYFREIIVCNSCGCPRGILALRTNRGRAGSERRTHHRSEEHTSELQSL